MFTRRGDESRWPKQDSGSGKLSDYRFDLMPSNTSVTIRLAGCDPHQDELRAAADGEDVTAPIPRRTAEEERTDAPMPVRLFVDGRVVGPVGEVPRGLEAVVAEAVTRLESAGRKPRIPVAIIKTRRGYRAELLMGETR